ncbi:hypothetical protein LMG9673_04804 [Ralstonia pseudosolanacearum]|nr:hypothetical protein LMG9673_04804 [Ralstonia pseudosolanacearum]
MAATDAGSADAAMWTLLPWIVAWPAAMTFESVCA